ncbi:MAG: bifunctional diaminohydroxyphosphoribosylaminopyrimidine deaminase/5-amino-6-(5-phosphoribosylamino)uracil reductase RibD, partial [Nitrospirota bacterium]
PHRHFMTLALRLAAKGRGKTSPNPMVGALVVKNGRIVGRGYHHGPGQPHAEIIALNQAGSRANGATLYVTLEPCCHLLKRTPPCVPAVIQSGVRQVVVAMVDPNPSVKGRGIAAFRRAGIMVTTGTAQEEAAQLNRAYLHWVRTGRPYVILKAGMTLDGKIATAKGESRWITGPRARQEAHRLRSQVDAVVVGVGTVIHDDPALTARLSDRPLKLAPKQPLRVVLDSRLRTSPTARICAKQDQAKTLIVTTSRASRPRHPFERAGVEILSLSKKKGRVSLSALMTVLGKRGITSVLIEGGSTINAAVLREKLVNHVLFYVAPTLLGGQDAKAVIGDRSPERLAQALTLRHVTVRRIGDDMVVEGDL